MITIFTALYSEAKKFIHTLKLKQNPSETLYQLFEGENFRLVITGSGIIASAIAAASYFTRYPSETEHDLVINIGIAGYLPCNPSFPGVQPGELFLVSKMTEQVTGRTFYPDFLYRHAFRTLPLITSPVALHTGLTLSEDSLVDMEATSLYQAFLPHISPDRMLFFKVVSDIPGSAIEQLISPEDLLASHVETILTYTQQLHLFLNNRSASYCSYTEEELLLIKQTETQLPMTEAMHREFERLMLYARLSKLPLCELLRDFLSSVTEHTIRGKKQAMPHFNRLRDLIVNALPLPSASDLCSAEHRKNTATMYQPFFATVYAEKRVWKEEWKEQLRATPIFIEHYKDIFNRSHQDFAAQKQAPSLILAKKTGTLLYPGAPVCQSFGQEHFYYTSCMMNCIYHCDYCYLQGMYPSGHVVVFVNLEDYFIELEQLLTVHPVYLCISYDTDLLALEQKFSFVSRWLTFARQHSNLTLEIRTKSGNPGIFEPLAMLYKNNTDLQKQIIFSWTVSPEQLCHTIEHGTASLPLRIQALLAAKQAGFSVRLCFDPMIVHGGWKESYSTLVDYIFSKISADLLYDVSIGVFRISTDYLKTMRKHRPDSSIVQYPYITENGVSHYGTLSEEMVHYLQNLLLKYLPENKIFIWNGGLE